MISNNSQFLEEVREAAEINRRAGDWVAPSPFPSRVIKLEEDLRGDASDQDAPDD